MPLMWMLLVFGVWAWYRGEPWFSEILWTAAICIAVFDHDGSRRKRRTR